MRGDIVLYKSSGSLSDWAISFGTHGPYVHVEIDLGNGQFIGAHLGGIVQHAGIPGRNVTLFTPPASKEDIEYGLKWAQLQVGKQYGWADIFSNLVKLCGIGFDISEPGHWDCSDFVTRYLTVARAAGPLGKQADDPGLVSPNDLARAYLRTK